MKICRKWPRVIFGIVLAPPLARCFMENLLEAFMNKTVNAVGFELEQKQSDMIEKKLKRLDYAEDLIIDLILRVKHDKQYSFDTTVNFRWGAQAHVSGEDYDFAAALNKMMDVLDNKVNKEKEKVQQKG